MATSSVAIPAPSASESGHFMCQYRRPNHVPPTAPGAGTGRQGLARVVFRDGEAKPALRSHGGRFDPEPRSKTDMAQTITAAALKSLLDTQATCALIDVREPGEYNDSHIPGSSLVPRRQLEFRLGRLVPYRGTHVIVCDDDGRRAPLAAATLESMGFQRVAVLDCGINRWTTAGYPTEWGVNVPSKDFGEKMQVVHRIAEMHPEELHTRQQRGDKI